MCLCVCALKWQQRKRFDALFWGLNLMFITFFSTGLTMFLTRANSQLFTAIKWLTSAAAVTMALSVGSSVSAAQEPATATEDAAAAVFSSEQKAAIERIVHDYLVEHPEVLVEVAQSLEAKQMYVQEQALTEAIEFFRQDEFIPRRGDVNAPHYLIEFFDYNCGYCKVVRDFTKRLAEDYDLVTIYVEFPILSALSVRASAIGLALFAQDPEKYLRYQDLLMTADTRITSEDQIKDAVKAVGGDYDKLSEAVNNDPRIQKALRKNMELGQKMGVQGTPYFILDGTVIRGAVKDYSTFTDIIEAAQDSSKK